VGQVAADGGLVADANCGHARKVVGQGRTVGLNVRRALSLAVRGQGAELEAAALEPPNPAQVGDFAQADHVAGLHQPLLQQQDERRSAGHELRVLAVALEQLERLLERGRGVVIERVHRTRIGTRVPPGESTPAFRV
jgi:hypothetical protein